MPVLTSQKIEASCYWDFAINGGALGVKDLVLLIPQYAKIVSFTGYTVTTVTSGTSIGTISFCLSTTGDVDLLSVTQNIANYKAASGNQAFTPGRDLAANPFLVTNVAGGVVNMVIAGEALTAGKIVCFIEYYKLPF